MPLLYQAKTKTGDIIKLPQVIEKVLIISGTWLTEGNAGDFQYQWKSKLYNLYGWIVFFNLSYVAFCELSYTVTYITDIVNVAESFCTSMIALFVVLRILHFRLSLKKFQELIELFSKEIWIDGEKYPRKIQQCNRIMLPAFIYFILLFLVFIIYAAIPIFVFYSTNQTMESKDKLVLYPMVYLYDVQRPPLYIISYISAFCGGFVIISNFYAHDAILMLFISHLRGQFIFLQGDIVRLIPECHAEWQRLYGTEAGVGGITSSRYDVKQDAMRLKLLQDMYIKRLHEVSARHSDLISFCVKVNDFVSLPLLMNVINSTFLICFCGFQFLVIGGTTLSAFMRALSFFLSVTLQLFMICTGGALLSSCTTDTTNYLYMCNWEGGRLSNNSPLLQNPDDMEVSSLNVTLPLWKHIKYHAAGKDFCNKLRFMIMRSQRPVELNAMKFTVVSLEGFSKIVSSSMSYFALLKTFLEED